ncbi:MAG: CPBP family glutamic-type intramembrane protease [Nitrososphaeraceae archaeon]
MVSSLHKELLDIKLDVNPKRWLSKYRNTSIIHLVVMLIFYHLIGVLLLLVGSVVLQYSMTGYAEPRIPRYLAPVVAAGPIEESVFFGIPFYATGNQFIVVISGITWVILHIFNTKSIDAASLSYTNWLFVMPSFFYSLRTWVSGKGWFAILAHSLWNGIFFALGCMYNEFPCSIFPPAGTSSLFQLSIILISASMALVLTLILYKRRRRIRAELGESR